MGKLSLKIVKCYVLTVIEENLVSSEKINKFFSINVFKICLFKKRWDIMANKFSKLVYFDEQAAVDFLESFNEGDITEIITKKVEKYTGVEGGANAGKGFLNLFKVGLSGNFGRNSNSLIETQISRTVFTEFMKKTKDKEVLVTFDKMKLSIAKDSLTYFRNITPYLKLFTDLKSVDKDNNLAGLNHLEMDKILDNAKGYYEFIGIDEDNNKKSIIRFNINGMRNNYSLYDLVKMDLSIMGIKVGKTNDSNLEFVHEISLMTQENEVEEKNIGLDFNEEQIIEGKKTEDVKQSKDVIDIIDVIIAGV